MTEHAVEDPGAAPPDAAAGWTARRPATVRDVVHVNQHLRDLREAGARALATWNTPPVVFRRGTTLVRVARSDDDVPVVQGYGRAGITHRLSQVADWVTGGPDNLRPQPPPRDVALTLLEEADTLHTIPVLEGVVQAPVFAPDGSLVTRPGYAPGARVWYEPRDGCVVPDVPERPTEEDLREARRLIFDELLVDFPFRHPADRAHAAGLALLPVVRPLVRGPTPLHLVEAPVAGTGKGLLAQALLFPATGGLLAPLAEGDSEAEWRKRITGKLLQGTGVVFIDNVGRTLASEALAAALTSTSWEDRQLGAKDVIVLPNRATWVATANNPSLSKELARRTVRVGIDAGMERPWEREPGTFRHGDLLGWVREHRGELVWALCVMVRSWLAAGSPPGSRTLGTYEEWTRVVGGVLEHAGSASFLGNTEAFYDAVDTETDDALEFVVRWWGKFGTQPVTARDLVVVTSDEGLLGALGREPAKAVGWRLARLTDTVHGTPVGHLRVRRAARVRPKTYYLEAVS